MASHFSGQLDSCRVVLVGNTRMAMAETGRRTKQCPTLHATDVVQNLLLVQSETFLVHENWSDALSDVKDG